MDNLREEVNEMLTIFEEYGFGEFSQEVILTNGVSFGAKDPYGDDNYKFDCFKFARFLKFCKINNIDINVNCKPNLCANIARTFDEIERIVTAIPSLNNVLKLNATDLKKIIERVDYDHYDLYDMRYAFDCYNLSREQKKEIITNGVNFNFSYGIYKDDVNRHFDCLKYARFLEYTMEQGIKIDAWEFLNRSEYNKYQGVIYAFEKYDELSQNEVNTRKRVKSVAK